jgi:catechol 2,3-dioxygenase-like lactoylglutathione lyase family enzyme
MTVKSLDHVNIQTLDMTTTVRFYAALLGLQARNAPGRSASERQWLYDNSERAILHINLSGTGSTFPRPMIEGETTGAIHHIAFECEDYQALLNRLRAMDMPHTLVDLPEISLRQIFVHDPNGVLLELNFRP